MAHELTIRQNGKAEMAYVGQVPWHGLGQQLEAGASIDEWRRAAGMDWEVKDAPVQFNVPMGTTGKFGEDIMTLEMDDRVVLYRSDTSDPLSVVSNKYQVVQPAQVLEYFDEMVKSHGLTLDTAGTLFGGKRFWALAKIGDDAAFDPKDHFRAHLMLATSVDGTLATTAKIVATRVVCNNTLTMAIHGENSRPIVKIPHSRAFSHERVNQGLGIEKPLAEQFSDQMNLLRALAQTEVDEAKIVRATAELFSPKPLEHMGETELLEILKRKNVKEVASSALQRQQIGAELAGMAGTPYGWLNAVTEHVDHHMRSRTADWRMEKSLFGEGEKIKQRAVRIAQVMADGTEREVIESMSDAQLLDSILAS